MTKDSRPETQQEAEALAREFKERICQSDPPTFNKMLDPEFLALDFEHRTLTLAYDFAPWMRNQVGILHGGIIGAAADIAMGVLTYTFSGRKMPPTISQQTSYLRTVSPGSRLIVRAIADKVGRTTASLRCELWMEDRPGELVATAAGTYSTAGKTYEEWLNELG